MTAVVAGAHNWVSMPGGYKCETHCQAQILDLAISQVTSVGASGDIDSMCDAAANTVLNV